MSKGNGVSKPSGPAGQTVEPGWKGNRDDLGSFRRFAGETVVTHFGGQKQTTRLPTVVGVFNRHERHKKKEDVDYDPVGLDFFVTDEKIFVRERRCLVCPGQPKGVLKVSETVKKELQARTPPICVTSFMTINRRKKNGKLVERPA